MSDPHLTDEQVERCLQVVLKPEEIVAVYEHLDRCDICRAKALAGRNEKADLAPFTALQTGLLEWCEPDHLFDDQITAFVDGRLDGIDREIVESHLTICASCRRATERITALHDLLEALPAIAAAPTAQVILRDASGRAVIDLEGNVQLTGLTGPSFTLGKWLRELATEGFAAPVKSVQALLSSLNGPAMAHALSGVRDAQQPVVLKPAATAVRSVRPTLRWNAVSGAQEYRIMIAQLTGSTRKIIWKESAGEQTQVELPTDLSLKPGRAYIWQVITIMPGRQSPSQYAGFVTLSEKNRIEVEKQERELASSSLALAALYEAYGLYEEALAQIERLEEANPSASLVQLFRLELLSRLDHEQTTS